MVPQRAIVVTWLALLIPLAVYSQDVNPQLIEAARHGLTQNVRSLLAEGADVEAERRFYRRDRPDAGGIRRAHRCGQSATGGRRPAGG